MATFGIFLCVVGETVISHLFCSHSTAFTQLLRGTGAVVGVGAGVCCCGPWPVAPAACPSGGGPLRGSGSSVCSEDEAHAQCYIYAPCSADIVRIQRRTTNLHGTSCSIAIPQCRMSSRAFLFLPFLPPSPSFPCLCKLNTFLAVLASEKQTIIWAIW